METLLIIALKSVLTVVILLTIFAHFMLIERKVLGYFQLRVGPNRTGPWGLGQPIADAVKVIIKEDIIPHDADRITYKLGAGGVPLRGARCVCGDPGGASG